MLLSTIDRMERNIRRAGRIVPLGVVSSRVMSKIDTWILNTGRIADRGARRQGSQGASPSSMKKGNRLGEPTSPLVSRSHDSPATCRQRLPGEETRQPLLCRSIADSWYRSGRTLRCEQLQGRFKAVIAGGALVISLPSAGVPSGSYRYYLIEHIVFSLRD